VIRPADVMVEVRGAGNATRRIQMLGWSAAAPPRFCVAFG